MTRSRTPGGQRPPSRPFEQQQLAEESEVADRVSAIMERIREFDQDKVQATVWWKQGTATGSWKWCDDVSLPPDVPAIMADMRERFGAGDYEIRVTALGRIRGNILFSIAKEKGAGLAGVPAPAAAAAGPSTMDIVGMMMAQQSEARRDAQAAADRQVTMITGLATVLAPLLLNRTTPPAGTSAADLVALAAAMNGGKGGGLKETLEAMAAFKTLMGDGGGGDRDDSGGGLDPDDLVGSAVRLIGPAMKAGADYLQRQRSDGAAAGATSANGTAGPPAGQLALGAPAAAPSRYRVLNLARDDVAYMFGRGFDPEKAADLVYDIVEANQVTEGELHELGAAFALSPTGLEDLAREGLDLRSDPAWAEAFFRALFAIHTDQADDSDGGGGGAPDAGGNGRPGAEGAT